MQAINTGNDRTKCQSRPCEQSEAPRAVLALSLVLGLSSFACSESTTDPSDTGGGSYAIATTIFQADGQTSLVALHEDPASEGVLDTTRALEVGGAAALFGKGGKSFFALGTSDEPVLTRYEVSDRNELLERERMSLQGYEVDSGFLRPDLVPFISDTKAYWIDDVRLQVVVWNPKTMEVTGSFSLVAAEREGASLELGEAMLRGDSVFVSASYRGEDELDQGEAVVLVIDAERDELENVITDPRCGSTKEIAADQDGTLYVASEALAASQHALDRPAGYPAPCVLRIPADAKKLDPDFYIAMPDLVGGRSAGRLVTGLGGHAYVLALHEELLAEPIGDDTDLYAPWESAAWRWWRISLGDASPGQLVEDAPIAGAASRVLRAGGRDFISALSIESGSTTLLVPTQGGGLRPGLEVSGYPYGLIKLR
jgi:hypothetical protein